MNKRVIGLLLFALLIITVISGCGQKQEISDAYEKSANLSATISESVPEIIEKASETESGKEIEKISETESKKEKETKEIKETTEFSSEGMPPRVLEVSAEVLSAGEEIEYSGMKMKVEETIITDNLDDLKKVMDDNDAAAFAQQLKEREFKCDSAYEKILIIKGSIKNDTGKERRMDMSFPVYWFSAPLETGALSDKISMSDFMAEPPVYDFWGEHTTYIDPHIGVKTSDSTQYHTFATGEVFDTVMVWRIVNEHIEAGKLYMGSNVMAEKLYIGDLPKGTQLIPVN